MEGFVPTVALVAFGSIVWMVKLVVENRTRRMAIEKGLVGPDRE